MEEKTIPYYAYDAITILYNKTIRRLWILCIILAVFLVGSNVGWLVYESQFEDVVTSVEQEAEWDSESEVIMNGTGTINYGESKTNSNN
jgi:hypothetical protein